MTVPPQPDKAAAETDGAATSWQNQLGLLAAIAVVVVIYGLVSGNWPFAGQLLAGAVILSTAVFAGSRLRRSLHRKPGSPPESGKPAA